MGYAINSHYRDDEILFTPRATVKSCRKRDAVRKPYGLYREMIIEEKKNL
jgi:hypothetical protein